MGPLHTLLIANRGEIALRVLRTARRLGLRTVAIFTDLDRDALHVRAADEAYRVPGYLDIDAVVAAAVRSGADAIHPGYGFVSERADFAHAVEAAGITLVGPPAVVMEQMGRKDAAREIAAAAGVPVVPRGEDAGFPVLVKAAAGGGGKGMHIVRSSDQLEEALAAARREARAAFGDDTLLIERYVERGRHIEVQVMADTHGTVLHLFERDCSAQRRHQKVLEEAPAPTISEELRSLVTDDAVRLARQVGYVGAGTVEFLLDEGSGQAYFLEMNTRLQVEHAVTEAITGLDLVELQLRVAAGERLPITQQDVTITGHAIEARVYAEDAYAGFLPQAGRASVVCWPEERVRVDHALTSGQLVTTSYDPMLGKIIAAGADRLAAREALVDALDRTAVLGLTTNLGFLRELAAGDAFAAAEIDTAWLDRHQVPEPDHDVPRIFAAWARARRITTANQVGDPFRADGWRSAGPPAPTIIELDQTVIVDHDRGLVDGTPVAELRMADPAGSHDWIMLEIDGRAHWAVVDVHTHAVEVAYCGQRFVFRTTDIFADDAVAAGDGGVVAPMPGTVVEVRIGDGDRVEVGQVLVVLEAMKMEVALRAPFDGTATRLGVTPGGQVALGDVLCVILADEQPPS